MDVTEGKGKRKRYASSLVVYRSRCGGDAGAVASEGWDILYKSCAGEKETETETEVG